MSKENVIRFMSLKEKDEELRRGYIGILEKYTGEELSQDEWDRIMLEEIIPFAKENGYDFTPEDVNELQKPAREGLSDEDLGQVVGGTRGFSIACAVENYQTFMFYFTGKQFNNCPSFTSQPGSPAIKLCVYCKNFINN